jgi:hypothetical protein
MAKSKTNMKANEDAGEVATPVAGVVPQGGKFARKSAVTLPTFKMLEGGSYYFQFMNPIRTETSQQKDENGKMVDKPIDIAQVVNVETGELGQIVVGSVLKSNLEKAYPNGAYVGKAFEIVKQKGKEGKRYRTYTVYEIDAPAAG